MSLVALVELRGYLSSCARLDDFFVTKFGKPAKHVIGYKKATNVNDCPFISYIQLTSERGGTRGEHGLVALVVGVWQQDISTDLVFQGVQLLAGIEDILVAELSVGPVGTQTSVISTIRVIDDFGKGHPYYEKELQFNYLVRPETV